MVSSSNTKSVASGDSSAFLWGWGVFTVLWNAVVLNHVHQLLATWSGWSPPLVFMGIFLLAGIGLAAIWIAFARQAWRQRGVTLELPSEGLRLGQPAIIALHLAANRVARGQTFEMRLERSLHSRAASTPVWRAVLHTDRRPTMEGGAVLSTRLNWPAVTNVSDRSTERWTLELHESELAAPVRVFPLPVMPATAPMPIDDAFAGTPTPPFKAEWTEETGWRQQGGLPSSITDKTRPHGASNPRHWVVWFQRCMQALFLIWFGWMAYPVISPSVSRDRPPSHAAAQPPVGDSNQSDTSSTPAAGTPTDRGHALLAAVDASDIQAITQLLDQGVQVDTVSEKGVTPLMAAASQGQLDVMNLLLARGANVQYVNETVPNERGDTPLLRAAYFGEAAAFARLLEAGARTDVKNRWDWTPVHMAAMGGCIPCLDTLHARGLSLHARATASRGETPLMLAASRGQEAVMVWLIEHGADRRQQDDHGQDALAWARFTKQHRCEQWLQRHLSAPTGERE
jgi:hypothetical protein